MRYTIMTRNADWRNSLPLTAEELDDVLSALVKLYPALEFKIDVLLEKEDSE